MTSATTHQRENGLALTDLGSVERMLVLHRTDRWYVGDFLRHACWLGWAAQNLPGARVDLATHSAYLPVYGDGRFATMVDVATLVSSALVGYDLVVEPTSFPVTAAPAPGIRRLLRTWDRGWALYGYGREVGRGAKDELNYFRSAHPRSLGLAGTTSAGISVEGTPLRFSATERQAARAVLDGLLPGGGPVVVYNPTASNPFTRETSAAKEVDNTLTVAERTALLRQIMRVITGHRVLVAAPVKLADARNTTVVRAVAAAIEGIPVLTGLREFAALLADPRVCSTVGGGTGSNTHLAALVGTWNLSIERSADTAMRANWSRPEEFQMGSFRWRNPSPLTAVHTMAWDQGPEPMSEARIARATGAFVTHHTIAHRAQAELFDRHRAQSGAAHCWSGTANADMQLGQVVTTWMRSAARGHLTDFTDEIAYLRTRFPHLTVACRRMDLAALLAAAKAASDTDPTAHTLAEHLFRDSNLHKLVALMRNPPAQYPDRAASEEAAR